MNHKTILGSSLISHSVDVSKSKLIFSSYSQLKLDLNCVNAIWPTYTEEISCAQQSASIEINNQQVPSRCLGLQGMQEMSCTFLALYLRPWVVNIEADPRNICTGQQTSAPITHGSNRPTVDKELTSPCTHSLQPLANTLETSNGSQL